MLEESFKEAKAFVGENAARDFYNALEGIAGNDINRCAAAAKTGLSIAEGDDAVLITAGEYKPFDGTLIIMKAGNKLKELKSQIQDFEKTVYLIENCGMQDEKIYSGLDAIPDKSGYFSILIVK